MSNDDLDFEAGVAYLVVGDRGGPYHELGMFGVSGVGVAVATKPVLRGVGAGNVSLAGTGSAKRRKFRGVRFLGVGVGRLVGR